MDIGIKIRNIRLQKGYSQEYMADYLNISQKSYSYLENEKTKIHLGRLIKIAEIFEISLIQMIASETNITTRIVEDTQLKRALHSFNAQLEDLREEIRLLRLEKRIS